MWHFQVWLGGEAGGCSGVCVMYWCFEKGYVPKCVNFAVVDTTHRLEENDLSNSGLETLARGLCNLTQLTAL